MTKSPTKARLLLAGILFLTMLVSYFDRVNVSVLVADAAFQSQMDVVGQPLKMGLLLSTFLFSYAIANIVLAPLGQLFGPRRSMIFAVIVWAASVGLGGLAQSFGVLLASRIVLGIGEGLHWPMQSIFIKNWFPAQERAKANSAWLLGIMVGPMIAIPMVTAVVANYGWRWSFGVLALISLLPLTLIWMFTADHPRVSRLANIQEISYIEAGQDDVVPEGRIQSGLSLPFMRDIRYWLIVIAFLCSACIFWGTVAWVPTYLKSQRGFTWSQMGWLASLPYLLGTLAILFSSWIADRVRTKAWLPVVSLLGSATGLALSVYASDNLTSAYALSLAVASLGIGLATYWTMMQGIVGRSEVGVAAGVMNGAASLVSAGVPALIGLLVSMSGGRFESGFYTLMALGVTGAACMVRLAFVQRA